jgi:hypothetical protein
MEASGRIERALDEAFAARDAEASSLVRAALRVAVLRQDAIAEYWLTLELEGTRVGVAKSEGHVDAVRRLDALLGPEESKAQRLVVLEAHIARRRMGAKESDGIMSVSVSEIELHGKSMQDIYDEAITPGMSPQDTALAVTRRDTARGTLLPTIVSNRAMLARIKDAAFGYLLEVETDLANGRTMPDSIARGREFVVAKLSQVSPDALVALLAAEDRSSGGNAEAMSHAATSCRRAIKALADALCPPTDPIIVDGITQVLDEEHYRNRLVEFVRRHRGKSSHANLVGSNITDLGTRLRALDQMASKGVHASISQAEAEACVTWTVMLAADLLRIYEETANAG